MLDRDEVAYQTWLRVRTPGVFERTFWTDYQQRRRQWLAGTSAAPAR